MDGHVRPIFTGSIHRIAPGRIEITDRRRSRSHVVDADADAIDAVIRLVALTDGFLPVGRAAEMAGVDLSDGDAADLIKFLLDEQLLVDACRCPEFVLSLGSGLHQASVADVDVVYRTARWRDARARDDGQPHPCSGGVRPLIRRRSFQFSDVDGGTAPLAPEISTLEALLRASYSPGEACPVPSAGALYPLALHALMPADAEVRRLFWFQDDIGGLADCGVCVRTDVVARMLVRSELVQAAFARGAALLSISVDLGRTGAKYGSRGSQFALIEAGAVLQRLHEAAVELELEVRAVGGFQTSELRHSLQIEPMPVLLVLVLGG